MNIIKPKAYREKRGYAACSIPELRELIKTPLGNIDVNPRDNGISHKIRQLLFEIFGAAQINHTTSDYTSHILLLITTFHIDSGAPNTPIVVIFSFSLLSHKITHLFAFHIWPFST